MWSTLERDRVSDGAVRRFLYVKALGEVGLAQ